MSARTEVLLWAQRVMRKKDGPACALLELRADATPQQAQEAFHKIARIAHPDLHRTGLTAEELELVTSAYAVVAGAYQTLRTQTQQTQPIRPFVVEPIATTGPIPVTPAGPAPAAPAAQAMSSKALVYYRKAELCLKRGDLTGAVLQLKLACAADPTSGFLRTALAEVQAEMRKG